MKLKFGDIKMEIPYEEYFLRKDFPFDAMFKKFNQDLFNDFYKMTTSGFTKYMEEFAAFMAKQGKPGEADKS